MQGKMMNTVNRVMRAYQRKHQITEDQAKIIRAEVSKFVDELLASKKLQFSGRQPGER
jgi:hypothetical protein